jgi:AAA15 family ATPase/GTPase
MAKRNSKISKKKEPQIPEKVTEMYSSLTIEGFRLFEHLDLNDLGRVNLFFGPNNSGKTSILEAIYTHACGLNFRPFQGQVVLKRNDSKIGGYLDFGDELISLFHKPSNLPYSFKIIAKLVTNSKKYVLKTNFSPSAELSDLDPRSLGQYTGSFPSHHPTDSESQLQLLAKSIGLPAGRINSIYVGNWKIDLNGAQQDYDLYFPPSNIRTNPPFKLANMHDILAHRSPESDLRVFSYLKRYGILQEFTKEMQRVFSEVSEIDMIPYPDGEQGSVYIKIDNDKRIPLYNFGDGMRRWFYLLGHMLVNKNAAHCIEEIDSTFHPKAQQDLSKLLVQYAERYNNQLFLTSHSMEFLDLFLESLYGENGEFSEGAEDLVRIFTIKREGEQSEIWSYTGREAYELREKFEMEFRS